MWVEAASGVLLPSAGTLPATTTIELCEGWNLIATPVVAWFIPDTAFSLWTGFWQNAVLNAVFALLFAIPLIATKGRVR